MGQTKQCQEKKVKYRCRCLKNKCRRTFTTHPDDMTKAPVCGCGESKWHVDQYRTRVGSKENRICHCDNVFSKKSGRPIKPHRWGCKGCIHREDAVIEASLMGRSTASDESWLIDK